MASESVILNLNDVKGAFGPLASLTGGGKSISSLSYPIDLGGADTSHLHWITFNINQQENTMLGGQASSRNPVSSVIDSIPRGGLSLGSLNLSFQRKTSRITGFINIYMPPTMQFVQTNQYADTSITEQIGLLGQGAQAAFASGDSGQTSSWTAGIAELLGRAGGFDKQLAAYAIGGVAINPQFEVLFQQVDLRTFQFDFTLSPRSKAEAEAIANIIKTFRFHSAPELVEGTGGRYLLPPSEFDISFHSLSGAENPNIPKLASCVCTQVAVDYAPSGMFATFHSAHPVSQRLTLQFKEVEIIHKKKVQDGF